MSFRRHAQLFNLVACDRKRDGVERITSAKQVQNESALSRAHKCSGLSHFKYLSKLLIRRVH